MSRKSRRERLPRLSFHTIKLPHSINRTHASTGATTGRTTSFHLVRGHFKTYTAERPLLGRATGTYWWGWQTRGSTDQGVVVSDYRVTPGEQR